MSFMRCANEQMTAHWQYVQYIRVYPCTDWNWYFSPC